MMDFGPDWKTFWGLTIVEVVSFRVFSVTQEIGRTNSNRVSRFDSSRQNKFSFQLNWRSHDLLDICCWYLCDS